MAAPRTTDAVSHGRNYYFVYVVVGEHAYIIIIGQAPALFRPKGGNDPQSPGINLARRMFCHGAFLFCQSITLHKRRALTVHNMSTAMFHRAVRLQRKQLFNGCR